MNNSQVILKRLANFIISFRVAGPGSESLSDSGSTVVLVVDRIDAGSEDVVLAELADMPLWTTGTETDGRLRADMALLEIDIAATCLRRAW